jgi:NADH-quinone oxidoreductase subunit M
VHPVVAVIATSGVVLAACYMLWMYRRIFFGPVESAENRSLIDLGLREKVVLISIVVPIFWIGVYPDTFLRRIEPSVIELLRQIEVRGAPGGAEPPSEAPIPLAALMAEGESR